VRGQRLPAIQLSTQYGRVAFPIGGFPDLNRFLTDWTVSVGATMPLFTGGRLKGEALVARADLAEARSRLQQTREFAALDAQLALAQLQEAEATWSASAGTAEQASKAYTIAEVRYREGISTQVELSESRLLLQQSQANRAQAARDLQVARVRLALLRDLPLSQSGGTQQQNAAALRQQQMQQQQQQQRQQQQQQQQQGAAATGQAGQ
jgi:outer membrane protein TolC